ncbi:PP0621 family protein [Thiopseudomonas alkaliphila]|uniref:PP0621 family protein n=1 Tax=Thiopseudomonas alkaliphila TaxID=1697053 RepID=UPI003306B828
MGIFRTILVFAIAFAIFIAWKKVTTNRKPNHSVRNIQTVRCAHCGMHLAKSSALAYQAEWFCNRNHKDAHYSH